MNEALAFETWDVFTDRRFAGNPLAVVFDAAGLSPGEMQSITREFDFSETVFVLPAEADGITARLRIFTPTGEIPFAGHPTVGAACAIARKYAIAGTMTLRLAAGDFPVRLGNGGAGWEAEFDSPNLPRVLGDGPNPDRIEAALGLPMGSVYRQAEKPRVAGAGIDFIYARAPLEALRCARLNHAAWQELDTDRTCGVLLYAPSDEAGLAWRARMFAPHIGVPEDSATGSAAAGLPAQLLAAGLLPDGRRVLVVEQGVEMGRPSTIKVDADARQGAIVRLSVGGSAVSVMRGELALSGH